MHPHLNNYLKRFVAWGTALRERYRTDLFFRTAAILVALQVAFVFACLSVFALALYLNAHGWVLFTLLTLAALLSGALLTRLTLRPAYDNVRNQKLFISNVAHELRTPLSTIKTSTEVALFDENLPKDLKTTFNEIVEELDRVSEILNNLLSLNTLARPERMQFHNVDIGTVIHNVVERQKNLAHSRGIRVVIKKHATCIVWGNTIGLEQVFTNILKNALSYTPETRQGVVTITIEPAEYAVRCSISDNGIGISQEDLYHIFEPFYRADMSRVRRIQKSGSGLGLTIVNEIIRTHHGKIHIESVRRQGTTVSVYLPEGQGIANARPKNPMLEKSETSVDFSTGFTTKRA